MIIALNNKSNLGKQEFSQYQEKLNNIEFNSTIIVCPNFLNISSFHIENMYLGAQNVSSTEDGAHTGEVSAKQLKDYGVEYCIVGHSERRQDQKEDNRLIREKISRLMEANITPILCVGETKEERENQLIERIIGEELLTATSFLTEEEKERIIIAYEPIWSIGTGLIPTTEEIEKVFFFIKTILPNNKILYGGSANEENIDTLKTISSIDGFLLGGLSLKPDKLQTFIQKIEK